MELEELMAGLFGGLEAPGAEDPRRRAAVGGESIGGPDVFVQRLMPYLMGAPGVIRGGRFGPPTPPPAGGLLGLLQAAASQNPIGGPNLAPGNLNTGQATNQPAGPQTRTQTGPGEGSLSAGRPTPPGTSYRPATSLPGLQARLGGLR